MSTVSMEKIVPKGGEIAETLLLDKYTSLLCDRLNLNFVLVIIRFLTTSCLVDLLASGLN